MGRLEAPDPAGAACPAERPLDIAEELTRQEVPREPTAVERDERPMRARPAPMDRAGKDFLADTGFPLQQHRHVAFGQHPGLLERLPERRAVTDDVDGLLLAQGEIDHRERRRFARVAGAQEERLNGACDVVHVERWRHQPDGEFVRPRYDLVGCLRSSRSCLHMPLLSHLRLLSRRSGCVSESLAWRCRRELPKASARCFGSWRTWWFNGRRRGEDWR
jgi:hypothetical protein